VCAAIANAALLIAPGYAFALVTRGFTGFFLAGVYPPAMKMVATWFRSVRGLAAGDTLIRGNAQGAPVGAQVTVTKRAARDTTPAPAVAE